MSTLTPEQIKRSNVGRMACIRLRPGHQTVYGNVLDLVAGTSKPKRIRVQHGLPEKHGQVAFPSEYEFLWWADEEEQP
jgi:hypothetical protein